MQRVLIANRGEIAVRIARGCRALGLSPVAVYSEADRHAPHVLAADAAVCVGPAPARESYLNAEALLAAARETGADAVHPGYGFFSENAAFAEAVQRRGPRLGRARRRTRSRRWATSSRARATVAKAGVPLVPGTEVAGDDPAAAVAAARAVGYPILVKAAAGGGGKGMRTVASEAELPDALAAASREAASAFADGRVYMEKLVVRPRHVEVQVLGDTHGTLVHLGERECSIQRRHQKIVEETPCPVMTDALRAEMTAAALAAARRRRLRQRGHGRVPARRERALLLPGDEHAPAGRAPGDGARVTGIDLVAAQLRVAMGERLGLTQADLRPRGHAIEVRLYAEDPQQSFFPSAGMIYAWHEPSGPGVRVDAAVRAGVPVPLEYDPMLAKISAWGADRDAGDRTPLAARSPRRRCSARPRTWRS